MGKNKILILLWCVISFLIASHAMANNYNAGTHAELIDAINNANTNPGPDTITLTADITLVDTTPGVPFVANGNNGLPSITTEVAIIGGGFEIARDVTGDPFRLLHIADSADVSIDRLTLRNGLSNVDAGAFFTFTVAGGAIFNRGSLAISSSSFLNNQAIGTNTYIHASGGAIVHVAGTLSVSDTYFFQNRSTGFSQAGGSGNADGGAISGLFSIESITGSIFEENQSEGGGAAVFAVGGTAAGGALYLNAGVGLISYSKFLNNTAKGGDGASSTDGDIGSGGAIYLDRGTISEIAFSTFDGNEAQGGTSFPDLSNGGSGQGGAIYLDPDTQIEILRNSTLSDNHAIDGDSANNFRALEPGSHGGAIYLVDATMNRLINSTLSGNTASGHGGAIDIFLSDINSVSQIIDLYNSTITLNDALAESGGGVYLHLGADIVNLVSNIVAANTINGVNDIGADLFLESPPLSSVETMAINNASFNLIGNGSGSTITDGVDGNKVGTNESPIDPELQPLADNGGPTLTHNPFLTSPAINMGANPAPTLEDQRGSGFLRVFGPQADIGAIELQCSIFNDPDDDGICNQDDNCPNDSNADQADVDSDGVGDDCDNCESISNADQSDVDNDTVGDLCDNCVAKSNQGQEDADTDNMGDVCDYCPTDPQNACDPGDIDDDGVQNGDDNCLGINNPVDQVTDCDDNVETIEQPDADCDGLGDPCDLCPEDPTNQCSGGASGDADGDGVPNVEDNCPGKFNPGPDEQNPEVDQPDTDADGMGDACDFCPRDSDAEGFDSDPDNDDICTFNDNCPQKDNPLQTDTDQDGIGDACDTCTDRDGDGLGEQGFDNTTCEIQGIDNCPFIANPSQDDFDKDDLGDRCDTIPGGFTTIPGKGDLVPGPVVPVAVAVPTPVPTIAPAVAGPPSIAAPVVPAVINKAPKPEVKIANKPGKPAKPKAAEEDFNDEEKAGCSSTKASSSTLGIFLMALLVLRNRSKARFYRT